MEIRFLEGTSLTGDDDSLLLIKGYANETNKFSKVLGNKRKFKEKIKNGVFQRALDKANENNQDINLLFEHEGKNLLASTKNGSLKLFEDEIGLRFEANLVPTSLGKDVYAYIKSGLIDKMSFGFRNAKDSWTRGMDNILNREITDLELFEISIVRNPAYIGSSVSARGLSVDDVDIPTEFLEERNDEESKINEKTEEVKSEVNSEEKTEEVIEEPKVDEKDEKIKSLSLENEKLKKEKDGLITLVDILKHQVNINKEIQNI